MEISYPKAFKQRPQSPEEDWPLPDRRTFARRLFTDLQSPPGQRAHAACFLAYRAFDPDYNPKAAAEVRPILPEALCLPLSPRWRAAVAVAQDYLAVFAGTFQPAHFTDPPDLHSDYEAHPFTVVNVLNRLAIHTAADPSPDRTFQNLRLAKSHLAAALDAFQPGHQKYQSFASEFAHATQALTAIAHLAARAGTLASMVPRSNQQILDTLQHATFKRVLARVFGI